MPKTPNLDPETNPQEKSPPPQEGGGAPGPAPSSGSGGPPAGVGGSPPPPKEGGGRAVLKACLIFLLIGALCFLWWYVFHKGIVSTDDAYVQGNIIRVTPLVSGTVIEILADGTQRVGEGEVLARLDKAEYELALNSSLDALKSACLNLKSLKDTREKLVAAIEAREKELALARSDYQRRLKLKKGSSVTAEERERYRIQAEVAEANLEVSKKELLATESLLGKGPLAEHPSVTKAASDAEAAWLKLKRTDILSPVAGKVARRSAQLGAQVSPSAPIMLVAAEEGVWVDANFKESQLKRIKPGMLARVTVDMVGRKEEFRGVVEGLSAGTGSVFSLLPPENATGNWIKVVQRVPVRVTLDKESLGDSPLILGLSCRVEVLTEEPESVSPRRIGSWRYGTDVLSEDPSEIREEIKKITDYYLGNTERAGDREGEGEGREGEGGEGGERNTGGISP